MHHSKRSFVSFRVLLSLSVSNEQKVGSGIINASKTIRPRLRIVGSKVTTVLHNGVFDTSLLESRLRLQDTLLFLLCFHFAHLCENNL